MLFQYYPYYSGGAIQNLIQTLNNWGLLDSLLPFILMFTILYLVIKKVGDPFKAHAGLLSLTLSAMILIPHILRLYPPQQDPFMIMSTVFPQLAILLIAIFLMLILLGMVGGGIPSIMMSLIGGVSVILLLLAIVGAVYPAFAPSWLFGWFSDPNVLAFIIVALVMGLVVYFVTAPEQTAAEKSAAASKTITQRLEEASGFFEKLVGIKSGEAKK